MSEKKDLAVAIMRIQPLHDMHKHLIDEAFKVGKQVLILVGSSHRARNIKNPFTFEERKAMVKKLFPDAIVEPVVDYMYDDDKWIAKVQATVAGVCENYGANPNSIVLVGHKKDSSSFYLDLFKQWSYHEVVPSRKLDATKIRSYLFAKDLVADDSAVPFLREMVPASIMGNIDFWSNTDDYRNLVEEYANIQKYKAAWASAPYQPTFVTTDAIVTCAGHVLMIRRKFAPGKGLLALPGGFLNPGERIIQGILRELKEETQINVGRGMLESMIREIRVFDHPDRSLRGRTITHTAHIPLNFKVLPEVKGDDDADGAMWVPFYDLALNRDQIFEDHGDQISSMTGVDL